MTILVRSASVVALLLISIPSTAASPRDELSRARQLYNDAKYDAAIDAAATLIHAQDLGDAAQLSADDRVELNIAIGESLYFDGQAGASAEQFELALAHADRKQPARHERL